jgi:hypothetical protein
VGGVRVRAVLLDPMGQKSKQGPESGEASPGSPHETAPVLSPHQVRHPAPNPSLLQDDGQLLQPLLLPSDGAGTVALQLGQLLQLQAVQPVCLLGRGRRHGAGWLGWGTMPEPAGQGTGPPGGRTCCACQGCP